MVKEPKPSEEVEVRQQVVPDEEEKQQDEKEVVVELDHNDEVVKKEVVEEKPQIDESVLEKLEKMEKTINFLSANKRHDDKLFKKVAELEKNFKPGDEKKYLTREELDEIAQKDWVRAVDSRFQELIDLENKKRIEEQKSFEEQQKSADILGSSLNKVRGKYPELEKDETAETSVEYKKILQEHPDYLNNPYGPVLAMHEMEERLKRNGKPQVKIVDREQRIQSTSLDAPKGNSSNRITLTREQQDFCVENGIPFEDYARGLKMVQR